MARGRLLLICEYPHQANERVRRHDPSGYPANLVVGIVLVEINRLGIVDGACEQAQSVDEEEEKLGREGMSGFVDGKNDR
jgi:hypothetical protein